MAESAPESSAAESPYQIAPRQSVSFAGPPVLKNGDAFGVFDHSGNIQSRAQAPSGFFFEDTRYLSRLILTIGNALPLLLSSTVADENTLLEADLTNIDLLDGEALRLKGDSVHLRNQLRLGDGVLFQSLALTSFAVAPCEVTVELAFAADFVDLFEVRGAKRARRGTFLPTQAGPAELVLAYRGLDEVERRTRIDFVPAPDSLVEDRACWRVRMEPGSTVRLEIVIRAVRHQRVAASATLAETLAATRRRSAEREQNATRIETGNDAFNAWLARSGTDLAMLITDMPEGPYPYAGIPWFSTAYGRDALITALECLWLDPGVAAGTLRFLAARQATEVDARTESEPGKILHETRRGEMATLGEIPFGRYYGSVDSTPLFLVLADAYHKRTGDLALIRALWPNLEAAIQWIIRYGDADNDGFIEYRGHSPDGLANQGWKDSGDAIFHRDGSLARGPIATVEVQAYCYAAYLGAGRLARLLGFGARADELDREAARLKARLETAFWNEELASYALALDGDKNQCQVRASNAGHVLLCGMASEPHAALVAESLMTPESFSNWGIRTVAKGESRYNPLSYHNGSIWPHDNALIAMGLARYGLKRPLLRLLSGIFAAATYMPSYRLPELFCGFTRRPGRGPVGYPVACNPQAWASAAVFAMLGAAIGIAFEADSGEVRFFQPALPSWLPTVRITNLRLRDASVDLLLERRDDTVAVDVSRRTGHIRIVQSD